MPFYLCFWRIQKRKDFGSLVGLHSLQHNASMQFQQTQAGEKASGLSCSAERASAANKTVEVMVLSPVEMLRRTIEDYSRSFKCEEGQHYSR
jgi:hypothetical protein